MEKKKIKKQGTLKEKNWAKKNLCKKSGNGKKSTAIKFISN